MATKAFKARYRRPEWQYRKVTRNRSDQQLISSLWHAIAKAREKNGDHEGAKRARWAGRILGK